MQDVQYCTTTTRQLHVQWDSEAMLTFHYRENYPSWMSTRQFWGLGPPKSKELDHPEMIRISEAQALRSAELLHAEFNVSVDDPVS